MSKSRAESYTRHHFASSLFTFLSFSCLFFTCDSLFHVKQLIYEQSLSHVWPVDLLLSSAEMRLSAVHFLLSESQAIADFIIQFLIFFLQVYRLQLFYNSYHNFIPLYHSTSSNLYHFIITRAVTSGVKVKGKKGKIFKDSVMENQALAVFFVKL